MDGVARSAIEKDLMKFAQSAPGSENKLLTEERRSWPHQHGQLYQISALVLLAFASVAPALPQNGARSEKDAQTSQIPPRVVQAERFLAQRGWPRRRAEVQSIRAETTKALPAISNASTAAWQPLGPTRVASENYGLVTGRVSSVALDPADATGNRVFVGTTGGGVWLSQNAGTGVASSVVFTPLTDTLAALSGARARCIHQHWGHHSAAPGGTGVILAGTGDPNDALDLYYGGESTLDDGGNSGA